MYDFLINVLTEPATEPVSTSEQKSWSRVDGSDEDTVIAGMVKTARMEAEAFTNRALIQTQIELWMNKWPGEVIRLPRPPLISVTSVKYYDESETLQTLSTSIYSVHAPAGVRAQFGEISLKPDQEWPDLGDTKWPIRITYLAGYGDAADDVPQQIKDAIKTLASTMYVNREQQGSTETFRAMLGSFRVW